MFAHQIRNDYSYLNSKVFQPEILLDEPSVTKTGDTWKRHHDEFDSFAPSVNKTRASFANQSRASSVHESSNSIQINKPSFWDFYFIFRRKVIDKIYNLFFKSLSLADNAIPRIVNLGTKPSFTNLTVSGCESKAPVYFAFSTQWITSVAIMNGLFKWNGNPMFKRAANTLIAVNEVFSFSYKIYFNK